MSNFTDITVDTRNRNKEIPAISIIVPIYNMEKYLEYCLDSIRAQTFEDWECILVDDGSTDNTAAICKKFADKDSRFKLVSKPNGGVSSARNAGLRNAVAEYIGFVDPDDWVEPQLFERLYYLATHYDAEVAQVGFWREYKSRRSVKHIVKETTVMDGKTLMREVSFDRLHNYLWTRLHKRSIIDCEFPEGRVFEDIYVYGKWLKNVSRFVIDPTPLYHYRMRRGSIVHEASNRTAYFNACIDKIKMMMQFSDSPDLRKEYAYINKSAIEAAKRIARMPDYKANGVEAIEYINSKVCEYELPPVKYMGLKKWWRAWLLRKNPKLFASLMRAVHLLDIDSKHRHNQFFD